MPAPPVQTYSELHPTPISSTITVLARRIQERFPGSGLSQVATELVAVAGQNQAVIEHLQRPVWWLRGLTTLTIAALIALVLWAALELRNLVKSGGFTVSEVLQSVDAATSELIFLSLVILFLVSLEKRLKRSTALRMLHRLRSIAHIVDMHQLTKDPEHALHRVPATASSPPRTLSRTQLPRYLDYCSELLALPCQQPRPVANVKLVTPSLTGTSFASSDRVSRIEAAATRPFPPRRMPMGCHARLAIHALASFNPGLARQSAYCVSAN